VEGLLDEDCVLAVECVLDDAVVDADG